MPSPAWMTPDTTTHTMSMPEDLCAVLREELQSVLRSELIEVNRQLDEITNSQIHMSLKMDNIDRRLSGASLNDDGPFTPPHDKFTQYITQGGMPYVRMPEDNIRQEEVDEPQLVRPSPEVDFVEDDPPDNAEEMTATNTSRLRNARQEKSESDLMQLLHVDAEHRKRQFLSGNKWKNASWLERLNMTDTSSKSIILDCFETVTIAVNAIFIGFSADNWNGEINAWCFVDMFFSLLFFLQLLMKLQLNGCALISKRRWSDVFDVLLIILDFTQLLLVFALNGLSKTLDEAGVPSASLFRIVRLLRVTRVIRLFYRPSCASLLQMIEGMMVGMTTLAWAMLLFGLIVYVIALLCNTLFGEANEHEEIYPYFKSVPRSMLTVFRCSFGDCSTRSGTPIPEFVEQYYGWGLSILYSGFVFFMTIGLFNVISAIFVNTTLEQQQENQARALRKRFSDETLWATRVCTIISRCLMITHPLEMTTESHIDISLLNEDLPVEIVHEVCQNDAPTKEALNDLDIDPDDHDKLADILDPDHSGQIGFSELMNGLQRLRGQPRRSDIVTIDLMLRSAQDKLDEVLSAVKDSTALIMKSENKLTHQLTRNSLSRRWELPMPDKEATDTWDI